MGHTCGLRSALPPSLAAICLLDRDGRKADLGSRRLRQPFRTTLCAHPKTMNSRCYLDHFESLKETAQHSGFQFSHVHSHSDFSLGNAFRASTLNYVKQYT